MKVTALIFSLFLSISIFASDDSKLTVHQDGLTIEVLDFEEGDKLKLFDFETGDHILSKSYAQIDLSQLPVGSYLLENNAGKSIVIDRQEEKLMIDGAVILEEEEFTIEEDSQIVEVEENQEMNVDQEFLSNYVNPNKNQLSIERDGDVIVVVDFEDGDKLKLFEVKDTIHVLSKTTNVVDLSQLPVGLYVLENSKGDSVIIEKFTETQGNLTDI
ncbi:hypothetical protein [uncultured Aquimarina sp.]|uniref:hypothetical protein n=1 Tax=uncultured Aquimarina sp. TaxID=575652 RepID=UPI0026370688|nr:hypothetical protein [uncultured Aquimarina sp.]